MSDRKQRPIKMSQILPVRKVVREFVGKEQIEESDQSLKILLDQRAKFQESQPPLHSTSPSFSPKPSQPDIPESLPSPTTPQTESIPQNENVGNMDRLFNQQSIVLSQPPSSIPDKDSWPMTTTAIMLPLEQGVSIAAGPIIERKNEEQQIPKNDTPVDRILSLVQGREKLQRYVLNQFALVDLQAACVRLGLPSSGRKSALEQRLTNYKSEDNEN
jgi:hypothetical protein